MSIRLGTSMMRRTRPRFLRTRKLDWTTDGIDFLRLYRARAPTARHEPSSGRGRSRLQSRPARAHVSARLDPGERAGPPGQSRQSTKRGQTAETSASAAVLRADPPSLAGNGRALLELDGRTSLGQLLLHLLGVGLGDLLLDRLRRGLDQVLRLLEAEAGDLADGLDDLDLVGPRVGEHDVELRLLRLLLGDGRRVSGEDAGDGVGRGIHAPLVLEGLDEAHELDHRHLGKIVDDRFTRDLRHGKNSFE